jgi:tetratricopeptide (TPR) repeat protein
MKSQNWSRLFPRLNVALPRLLWAGTRLVLVSLIIGIFSGRLVAADNAEDFSTANRFYAEGKFTAAAEIYGRLLNSAGASPNLLFNYGNAEFKSGNLGRAIAAFRRAELIAPRDAEIRANLDYVRNQVQGSAVHEARWQDWLGQLKLNEWTLLTAAAFWLALILFTVRQIRPVLVPRLKSLTTLCVCLTILLGVAMGLQAANHFTQSVAVVTSAAATARSGPFDDAQSAFAVHDGAELFVISRHDDWVQVTDASGKIGWLNTAQAQVVPGA